MGQNTKSAIDILLVRSLISPLESVYDFKAGLSHLCIYNVQLSPLTLLTANG